MNTQVRPGDDTGPDIAALAHAIPEHPGAVHGTAFAIETGAAG
jgi:hypothetical protein